MSNTRRRSGLMAAIVAVALGLSGASMVTYAVTHQEIAPQPSAATSHPAPPTPPASPAPANVAILPAARPTFIQIPAIGVSSPINIVGLNPDHTIDVPHPGPLYDQAAWYRYSPTPGELGPSVILGHIDSAENGPSVFYTLGNLTPGQRIQITRADATIATFQVDSVESYPKDSFPLDTVYGDTDNAALRLITCGGSFDTATHQYRDNTVVFAHLTNAGPLPTRSAFQ